MNAEYEKAWLLYQQDRYDLAAAQLRQILLADPNHSEAHALLGLCLSEQEKFQEATGEAKQAVHLGPDIAFNHYALAAILHERNRIDEALAAGQEALRLDPRSADILCLIGSIHLSRKDWAQALQAAEEGLECNAEHVGCTNLRAMALVKLGRKNEAGATIEEALARSPEDDVSHANMGWTLLEKGDPKKALEHFREALRLNPQSEFARLGIIEAMKARYFIYGLMLKYFLWMSKLSDKAQWAVIIGFFVGNRILRTLARSSPDLAPWIMPVLVLYMAFALMTWIADPLFNLLLRLNRFGRLALSREQIMASNFLALTLIAALGSLGWWIVSGDDRALGGAMAFGFLLIPVAGVFHCSPGWPRITMGVVTALLALFAMAGFGLSLASSESKSAMETASLFTSIAVGGCILASWAGIGLSAVTPRR